MAVAIGLLLFTGDHHALAQTATDQRCAKGADVRRIEIRFADDSGNLPCRVIYRPEADSDKLGIVSWQDISDLPACQAQANEVVERLTVEGWTCAEDVNAGEDDTTVAEFLIQNAVDNAAPNDAPLADVNAPDIDDADRQTTEIADQPARLIDNPDLPPPTDELVSIIEEDLDRLDTTLDGLLVAEIAGYGDLNADDIDDALVLFTYSSPQPAYRQFLAAYMFDDESYQLTATKPVGGHINATKDARVEAIDGGVIHLTLQAFEPGDASCCPSGTRRLALALRDLDLVEIDADVPTR